VPNWDYLRVDLSGAMWVGRMAGAESTSPRSIGDNVDHMLGTVGAEGWELVSVPADPSKGPWIFKRPA
jgi:hypothetical protein